MGAKGYKPPPTDDVTGIEEDTVSNSQEATPIALMAGERKIAVTWISRVYKQFTKEAPMERPGKK
jgi:hypothetical protein